MSEMTLVLGVGGCVRGSYRPGDTSVPPREWRCWRSAPGRGCQRCRASCRWLGTRARCSHV